MKFVVISVIAFILLLVFGLCKISGEYDDEMEKRLNTKNGGGICE